MGKGIGLIGNFRGKVGNMVGYNLKDSNNKQTQGVRVYQPIVKNPKTAAQAEQRAKMAPINAVYRLLKPVIDRGQESKAYGNKSRLAWLRMAIIAYAGMWTEKGKVMTYAPLLPLTKGSLGNPLSVEAGPGSLKINVEGLTVSSTPKIGTVSTAILAAYPSLKDGDQITLVGVGYGGSATEAAVASFVLDSTSTADMPAGFSTAADLLVYATPTFDAYAFTSIISREGANGEHLRSSATLVDADEYPGSAAQATAKADAIKSYMAASGTTDWPEEQI